MVLPMGRSGRSARWLEKKPLLDPVHAQLKAIAVGRRGHRVGAGLLFAFIVRRHAGNKLAGDEGKALQLVENEVKVIALGNFADALFACKACCKKFTSHDKPHGERYSPQSEL